MTVEEIRAFIRAEGPKYLPRGHSYSLTFGTAMFLAGLEAAQREMINVLPDEWEPVVRSNLAPLIAAARDAEDAK